MNNRLIIIILIIAVIMLIIEGILLISALFLFAKNEKERQKIAEIYENKIEEKEKTEEVEKKPKIWEIEIPTLNVNGNIHEGINNKIISDSIGYMKTNQKEEAVILKSLTNDTNKYFEKLEEIIYKYNEEIKKYIVIENKIIVNEKEKIKLANKKQILLFTNVKDLPKVLRCVVGQIIE